MSELDKNIPDDFWRKAFEEATEVPPSRVWDAIEHRLDEDDETKILPLWGAGLASSRPFIWGTGIAAAAAVALLLVGWWSLRTVAPENTIAQHQPPSQAEHVAVAPTPMATDCWPRLKGKPQFRQSAPPARQTPEVDALNQQLAVLSPDRQAFSPGQPANRQATNVRVQSTPEPVVPGAQLVGETRLADVQPAQIARQSAPSDGHTTIPPNDRTAFVSSSAAPAPSVRTFVPTSELRSVSAQPTVAQQSVSFDLLRGSALQLRQPGSIQRIVWFRPTEPTVEPATIQPKREKRELWASMGLMPGAFDPAVAVRSAQASFSNANSLSNASVSQSSVTSRASFSMAYQAGAGIQLTEHWSVESGVGYLAGRSTVDSPVRVSSLNFQLVGATGSEQRTTLYADALRNSSIQVSSANSTNSMASFDYAAANTKRYTVQNSYNSQDRQSVTNDYQFVQVPVQVGYQLRPRKRLGLALIGGFLSNIFVRNTVGDNLVVTARDGVYRPVSWAATLGARFRYRPSRQWSASLAGVYQPSLGPGTRPESAVQTQPTSTGMSFGIDYHF